jgi:hypothetical protein
MSIKELSDWSPWLGGAHEPGREIAKPENWILIDVYPANGRTVTFRIEGENMNCHVNAHSVESAEKITEALLQNLGKTVTELGDLEVPASTPLRAFESGSLR